MEAKHIEAMRRWVLWYSGKLPGQYDERPTKFFEAVKAAIRDAEQTQQAMAWLPIETHPGFSDPCLVRVRYGISEGVLVCEAHKVPGCPWAPCSDYESFDDMLCCDVTVTHWMPMPSPDLPLAGQAALDLSPAAQIAAEYDELALLMTMEYVKALEDECYSLDIEKRRWAETAGEWAKSFQVQAAKTAELEDAVADLKALLNRSNAALRETQVSVAANLGKVAAMRGFTGTRDL